MGKKSGKKLAAGIVAAAVVLFAVVGLLLMRCTGEMGSAQTSATETTQADIGDTTLYWNVDFEQFAGKSEAGMSSRQPEADGDFHIRFFVDGQTITMKARDRKLVNTLDSQSLMGLKVDEEGYIIDVIPVDDMPVKKTAWQFYVQSFGGKTLKLNSSSSMNGIELLLEGTDNTHIYDMTGSEGQVGMEIKPIPYDRVYAISSLDGELTHVFIYDRPNFMHTHEGECAHCGKTVTWSEWVKTDELPVRAGHYQLQNDVQLKSQAAQLTDTAICLDLNGKRVDGAENARVFSMHNSGAELAIMDTSEAKTGVMASHGTSAQGLVVWIRYGQFHLYSGTLDASDSVATKGGTAVAMSKGRYFYMHGGTIIGGKSLAQYNTTTKKYSYGIGGSLYMSGGKFVMRGGEIRDGYAKSIVSAKNADGSPKTYQQGKGGNIYANNSAVIELYGGVIRDGRADNGGANIYLSGGAELLLDGGRIEGGKTVGKGRNGGSIYITSTARMNMRSGRITGGSCYNGGGNIYTNGKFVMYGGYIGGGTIRNYSTGKVVEDAAHRNIFVVNANFVMYGGKIDGGVRATDSSNTDNKKCLVTLSSRAIIDGGENSNRNLTLSLGAGGPVQLTVGPLHDKAMIRVNAITGVFTKPTQEKNLDNFVSDIPGADILYHDGCLALGKKACLCGASEAPHLGKCEGEAFVWAPLTATSQLSAGGHYYLTSDISSEQISLGEGIVTSLDLNGHNYISSGNNCFLINGAGAQLNLCDHAGTGYLKGRGFPTPNQGGAVYVRVGSMDIYGGTITKTDDYQCTNHGGLISVRGTLNMYAGTVTGGSSPLGGNISVTSSGVLNIYGGTVQGGTADQGSNIYVTGKGLTLAGGTVDGGITVEGTPKLTLSGKAVVTDKDKGLQIPTGILADVSGLKAGASIAISAGGYFAQGANATALAAVKHVRSELDVSLDGEKLFVGRMACLCGKTPHVGNCNGKRLPWMPLLTTDALTTTGNYYLIEDMSCGQIAPKDGVVISLDLNGHTLSSTAGRLFMPYETTTLNICDHADGGKLLGKAYDPGKEAQGGVVYVRAGSTMNLYGGTIGADEGYGAANHGGMISVRGTLNMYGGTVTGGKSTLYGGCISVTNASSASYGIFNFYSGTVKGGSAPVGSSIYVTTGRVNLLGGSTEEVAGIKGSIITFSDGSADKVTVSGGTLKLSGTPVIGELITEIDAEGNKPLVTAAAALTEGASITVSDLLSDGVFTDTTLGSYAAFFRSKDADRGVYAIDNPVYDGEVGALYLGQYHCLCGSAAHMGSCDGKSVKWTALSNANAAVLTETGNYYLSENVTIDQTSPKNGVVISIDLNGHILSASASRAFMPYDTTTLNICDHAGGGKVLGKAYGPGKEAQGGVIYVRAGSTMNLYGGTIGADEGYGAANHGGIISVRGTLNMYGGKVIGGKSTLYGGTISVTTATGLLNLYGGTVTGGTAPMGGSVYVTGGNVNISGGSAEDVFAAVTGTLAFSDGSADKVTVSGGTLKLSGTPEIGELITETDAEGNKPLVTAAAALTEGAGITVTKTLPDGVFSDNTLGAYAAFFSSEDENRGVYGIASGEEAGMLYLGRYNCLCGKQTHVGSCDGKAFKWTALDDTASLKTGGSYYLTSDMTTAQLSLGKGIVTNLDLNGHDLIAKDSNVFLVNGDNSTRLSLCDHAGGGTLQGRGFATANQGGAVYIRAGNMDMYGGTICKAADYQVTNHGGLVSVRGTLHMYDGTIEGGTSQQYGGNVSVSSSGVFYFHGGTISGGSAPKGGNICVTGSAKLYIQGGMVKNGIASESGGNVYVDKQNTVVFEMIGGELLDGTATQSGGNLFVLDAVGTKSITGGSVTGGTAPTGSCAYVEAGTLTVGQNAVIEKLN